MNEPTLSTTSTIMHRLDALAEFSEETDKLTRTYLTPVLKSAAQQIVVWMNEAGMQTHTDEVGNVIGRYEGTTGGLPAFLIGSHFDTVRNAGRYDGMYGVLAAIEVVHTLNRQNERFSFAIEVIAFADEEGTRFGATLLGSRGVAGNFDGDLLKLVDENGVSMYEAMINYGLDPTAIEAAKKPADSILGYLELHIEQGPVLIEQDLPIGIVTAIAGASRFLVTVQGVAGHAGTVPMGLRQDALIASAEAVLALEEICLQHKDSVGTVGKLSVTDGATNVIPGNVQFTVDIRCGDDQIRHNIVNQIESHFSSIGQSRNVEFDIKKTHEASAATCSQHLIEQLKQCIARHHIEPLTLLSGAGHDAMALADLTPISMLFVRCGNNGISHHPDEIMTEADAKIGIQILLDFIRHYSPK